MSGQTVSSRPIQFSAPGNDLNLKKKKKKKKKRKKKSNVKTYKYTNKKAKKWLLAVGIFICRKLKMLL